MKSISIYGLIRNGRIVYVGITNNFKARLYTHRRNGKRFDEHTVFATGLGRTREEILEAEATLIEKYRPEYNRAWNPDYDAPAGYSVCKHSPIAA
jgi:predicted GIY-YIG superfamily endonuclease